MENSCGYSSGPALKELPAPRRPFRKLEERVFGPQRLPAEFMSASLAGMRVDPAAFCPPIDR